MNNLSKIGLGSAQWGSNYGISNEIGETQLEEIKKILKISSDNGIEFIDTAFNYGNAEKNLGKLNLNNFRVITKTPKFDNKIISKREAINLEKSFFLSLQNLGLKKVYGLLFHRPEDLLKIGGELLIQKILDLKERELVKKIGISIYDCSILEKILPKFTPDIIQLPLNVFDQDSYLNGTLKKLKDKEIEIHARSIFLQGILLLKSSELPNQLYKIKKKWKIYEEYLMKNKVTAMQICLRYILNFKGIKKIVIGIDSKKQLEQILNTNTNIIKMKKINFGIKDKKLIDPRYW